MSALLALSVYGIVVDAVVAVAACLWAYYSACASAGAVLYRRACRASHAGVGGGGSGGGSSVVVVVRCCVVCIWLWWSCRRVVVRLRVGVPKVSGRRE